MNCASSWHFDNSLSFIKIIFFLHSSNFSFFLCYLSFHLDQRNVIVKGLLHKVGVEEHLKRKDNNTIIAELYCWGHHVLDLCHHKSEKKLYWNCTCRCHHNLQKIPFQSIFVADVPRDDVGRGRQEPIWFCLDWSCTILSCFRSFIYKFHIFSLVLLLFASKMHNSFMHSLFSLVLIVCNVYYFVYLFLIDLFCVSCLF